LQIPSLILILLVLYYFDRLIPLPGHLKWVIIALVIVSDIALLPLLWRSYDTNPAREALSMIGEEGRALEDLRPEGSVRVHGERWRARLEDGHAPVIKGDTVEVVRREGLVLTVRSRRNV
jgi:membrane-bound ClpP family serine protease